MLLIGYTAPLTQAVWLLGHCSVLLRGQMEGTKLDMEVPTIPQKPPLEFLKPGGPGILSPCLCLSKRLDSHLV